MAERKKAPPPTKAQVPARVSTEQAMRAGVEMPQEQVTGLLIQKHWGNIVELQPEEATRVARAIHESFPHWGPWQVINNFDILGGTTLYLNANGYMDIAAAHPMTEEAPLFMPVDPDTDEWSEYLGDTDPKTIAAAYICEYKRKDRTIPFREFNYCQKDDSLLYNWKGQRGERSKTLKPDWQPLAKKIARTRALRRTLRLAFSPTEAAAIYAEKKVEGLLGEAAKRELPKPVGSAEEPYGEVPTATVVGDGVTVDPDSVLISERDRRKLFAVADNLNTAPLSPHDTLKLVILEMKHSRGQTDLTVDNVHTRELTYGEYAEVVERLTTGYPFKDRETEEVNAEVTNDQAKLDL